MTPKFYEQVCCICYEALQLETAQRPSFLDGVCAGDALLRREVEAMLAYEAQEKSFLAAPALVIAANQTAEVLSVEGGPPLFGDWRTNGANSSSSGILTEPFAPGMTLDGRYLIEKELGQGGICAVFLARDQRLNSMPVVIKVLLAIRQQTLHKFWYEKKFKGEIAALTRIDHPGVVRALDVGELPGGQSYLVMQYVSGASLRDIIPPEGMKLERVAKLIRQMGQALAAAHRQGVIHRDLKPENIMVQSVGDEEYVKIIDFGIATVYEMADAIDDRTTQIVGTRSYLAPEQLLGKPVAASDIYALGVIAYEMVTGRQPFNPDSIFQLYELQRAGVRVKPCDLCPSLPETAQSVILKALSFATHDRFTSAKDFADALANALTGEGNCVLPPPRIFARQRRRPLTYALIVVAVIGFLALSRFNFRNTIDLGRVQSILVETSERCLSCSTEARRDPTRYVRAKPLAIFDNAIFGASDKIHFYISSPHSGALYVINEVSTPTDELPNFNILFPDTQTNGGPPEIRAGSTSQTPPPSQIQLQDWVVFNREEGGEDVWLVWADRPVPELEAVKDRANPKGHGGARESKRRASLSRYLAALLAIRPEVEKDAAIKWTKLKCKGEMLVWVMKLERP
jgi:serine/threonine protein kinase